MKTIGALVSIAFVRFHYRNLLSPKKGEKHVEKNPSFLVCLFWLVFVMSLGLVFVFFFYWRGFLCGGRVYFLVLPWVSILAALHVHVVKNPKAQSAAHRKKNNNRQMFFLPNLCH